MPRWAGPVSSSTNAAAARRSRAATSRVVASAAITGNRARRDCLPLSRAIDRQRSSAFSPRSARHWVTDRDADQGTISSTPTSVRTSTARSPRSPLASACTTTRRGCGSGSATRTARRDEAFAGHGVDHARHPQPGTVHQVERLARREPRTFAACRPSGPSSTTRSPRSIAAVVARNTGAVVTGSPRHRLGEVPLGGRRRRRRSGSRLHARVRRQRTPWPARPDTRGTALGRLTSRPSGDPRLGIDPGHALGLSQRQPSGVVAGRPRVEHREAEAADAQAVAGRVPAAVSTTSTVLGSRSSSASDPPPGSRSVRRCGRGAATG